MPSRKKPKSTPTAPAWRCTHKPKNITTGDFCFIEISRSRLWADGFRVAPDTSAVGNGKQRKARSADREPHDYCGRPFYREWLCGAGQDCRGRVLERLYIDNCLPLTVELFHQLALFILSCKPISYCRFKRIDVYTL